MTGGALEVSDVTMTFGGITALSKVSFGIEPGQICGLIGPNGAGKTTMFNCISGLYRPQAGRIYFDGVSLLDRRPHQLAELGISRTFQNLGLYEGMTVLENVMLGGYTVARQGFVAAVVGFPGVRRDEQRLRGAARDVLHQLNLQDLSHRFPTGLPYGTLKRIELARALVSRPKLLMLDEPASGLVHGEVSDLIALISTIRTEFDVSVLLVEHVMRLVMQLADTVVVLNFGSKLAEGTTREIQENSAVVQAYLGAPR